MADELERDNAGVVAPPPLIYLGFLALGLLLNRASPSPFLPGGLTRVLGWPLVGGGLLLGGWFFRALSRAGTPVEPWEPVTRLVTDGPYRYTRNPGYLSMAMVFAGIAASRNALSAMLLLPVTLLVVQRGVIEREERYLEKKFGEEYLRYKARARRWI